MDVGKWSNVVEKVFEKGLNLEYQVHDKNCEALYL